MNKVLFAGLALVAVAAIAYIGQEKLTNQAAAPDKAPADVSSITGSSCCGGCCGSSEKMAEAPGTELASEKSECCGGCAETKLVAAEATEKCPGTCAEGDGSKCCQSPKQDAAEEKTELVSETSEESAEENSDSQ